MPATSKSTVGRIDRRPRHELRTVSVVPGAAFSADAKFRLSTDPQEAGPLAPADILSLDDGPGVETAH